MSDTEKQEEKHAQTVKEVWDAVKLRIANAPLDSIGMETAQAFIAVADKVLANQPDTQQGVNVAVDYLAGNLIQDVKEPGIDPYIFDEIQVLVKIHMMQLIKSTEEVTIRLHDDDGVHTTKHKGA